MTNLAISMLTLIFMFSLAGCALIPGQKHTPTPTELIHVHSFFSAYAFLDTNDNGQFDPSDTPIRDATLIVVLPGGTEFGDQTDDTGNAFITIPADVAYPVTLRMEAPKDSTLKPIEPSAVVLSEASGEPIQFLFSSR
jgi:hypothetical protein